MNREIKFRAWDSETKKMIATGFHVFGETTLLYGIETYLHENLCHKNSVLSRLNDVAVTQFTGFKDKNGKEIYEGDICRKLNTDWPSKPDSDPRTIQEYMNDIASVGVVVFEDCEFQLSVKRKKYYDECFNQSLRPGSHGFIEVIGNIYEHTHLLK